LGRKFEFLLLLDWAEVLLGWREHHLVPVLVEINFDVVVVVEACLAAVLGVLFIRIHQFLGF